MTTRERCSEHPVCNCHDPELIDLVRELREILELPNGALPISPSQAWREALDEVRALRRPLRRALGETLIADEWYLVAPIGEAVSDERYTGHDRNRR